MNGAVLQKPAAGASFMMGPVLPTVWLWPFPRRSLGPSEPVPVRTSGRILGRSFDPPGWSQRPFRPSQILQYNAECCWRWTWQQHSGAQFNPGDGEKDILSGVLVFGGTSSINLTFTQLWNHCASLHFKGTIPNLNKDHKTMLGKKAACSLRSNSPSPLI